MSQTFDTVFTNARANLANFMGINESELSQEIQENLEAAIKLIFEHKFLFEFEKLMEIALGGFIIEVHGKQELKNPLQFVTSLKHAKELLPQGYRFDPKAHCVETVNSTNSKYRAN